MEVSSLLLLNRQRLRTQRLGDIANYLVRHTKPIFAATNVYDTVKIWLQEFTQETRLFIPSLVLMQIVAWTYFRISRNIHKCQEAYLIYLNIYSYPFVQGIGWWIIRSHQRTRVSVWGWSRRLHPANPGRRRAHAWQKHRSFRSQGKKMNKQT